MLQHRPHKLDRHSQPLAGCLTECTFPQVPGLLPDIEILPNASATEQIIPYCPHDLAQWLPNEPVIGSNTGVFPSCDTQVMTALQFCMLRSLMWIHVKLPTFLVLYMCAHITKKEQTCVPKHRQCSCNLQLHTTTTLAVLARCQRHAASCLHPSALARLAKCLASSRNQSTIHL